MTSLLRSLYPICFCLIIISACSKDKDPDMPAVDPCDRIIKVFHYAPYGSPTWQLTATFDYDAKGRIQHVTGEGQNAATYTYYKDKIELSATDIFGKDISVTYYLDAKGRVKGTSYFDHQFTYNADGYLISFRQPYSINGQITGFAPYTLKYEQGDLIEIATTENVRFKKINFVYYDEPNQNMLGYNQPLYIGSVLGDRNTFFLTKAGFFGKLSTHLFKTVDLNDGSLQGQVQYNKDAKGRVTSTNAYSFTYQCP